MTAKAFVLGQIAIRCRSSHLWLGHSCTSNVVVIQCGASTPSHVTSRHVLRTAVIAKTSWLIQICGGSHVETRLRSIKAGRERDQVFTGKPGSHAIETRSSSMDGVGLPGC